MTDEEVRRWREEAAANLRRPSGTTAGAQAIRSLTDERDARIVALCDDRLRLAAHFDEVASR